MVASQLFYGLAPFASFGGSLARGIPGSLLFTCGWTS